MDNLKESIEGMGPELAHTLVESLSRNAETLRDRAASVGEEIDSPTMHYAAAYEALAEIVARAMSQTEPK